MKTFVKYVWVAVALGLPAAKVGGVITCSWTVALLPVIVPVAFAVCVVALAFLGHALNAVGLAPFGKKKSSTK